MSGALDTRPNATTFVLDDLVGQAWAGRIRVPHFQRGLRWDRQDVLRLFDSILKGYPIGNLLLWVRPSPRQTVVLGELTIESSESQEAFWVVDGQQRITSLANALHPEGARDPRFDLAYDLTKKKVVARPKRADPLTIPLPVVFDLKSLVAWQIENPELGEHIEEAAAITKQLREFTIPTYLVRQDNPEVLQDIFDRMNNYGKKLTRAEVFSALYAGEENPQDPALDIKLIADRISAELEFGLIDEDTVMRALLARRGPDVEREIRLEFNDQDRKGSIDFPDESRDTAFELGGEALRRAVAFLQDEAHVPHISMLPYRYLLVVLTRYFSHDLQPDTRDLQLLRRWFWRSAIGGPYVVKGTTTATTRTLNSLIRPGRSSEALQELLDTVDTVGPGSTPGLAWFRTNTAATKILLASWWDQQPRSLRTGKPYTQTDLAATVGESSTAFDAIVPILRTSDLPDNCRSWPANRLLLVGRDDQAEDVHDSLFNEHWPLQIDRDTVLESHLIKGGGYTLLHEHRFADFMEARQQEIATNLLGFLQRMCEWGFEDTPSLDDLMFDQTEMNHTDHDGRP